MTINAYVLAADPSFLAASVRSYYELVERIVISYDEDGLSWSGEPTAVDECLAELQTIDHDGKLDLRPDKYSCPERAPIECETAQRQAALAVAGENANWVLQLDSDEVVPEPSIFLEMVRRADSARADALHYPSRWLYTRTRDGRYLERCTRWWRAAAGYPGPLAVRPGTVLRVARQCDGDLFRVDFRARNTDPWHDAATPVHATVPVSAGVLHFSWVRSHEELAAKAAVSGHRDHLDWAASIRRWRRRQRHPIIATALTPLRPRGDSDPSWLRLVKLSVDPPARLLGGGQHTSA
jgi:hypothetical protein